MEAEIIALSACCRELFPIIDMVTSLMKSVNLPIGKTTMNVSMYKDNSGALVLAKTLLPQFTPQSKYYTIKTIWFCCEEINTVEHLGDIFTKGLTRDIFEYLQMKKIPVSRESVVLDHSFSNCILARGVGTPQVVNPELYCLMRPRSRTWCISKFYLGN
jgi:hypothetical protein